MLLDHFSCVGHPIEIINHVNIHIADDADWTKHVSSIRKLIQ